MVKASFVAKQALQLIIVQASEAELEASETQDFIDAMNVYMLALDADGIKLGYTMINDLGDTVTVPDGALMGVITNSALYSAPQYGVQPSGTLLAAAKWGLEVMEKIGTTSITSAFPDTLPVGSGNEQYGYYTNSVFYPDLQADILAEISGSIGLESETT